MLGIFLDTEANGLNFYKHRLLEIAYKIVDLYTGKELDSFDSVLKHSLEVWDLSDLQSLKVNGFTFEEVQKGQEESTVKELILKNFQIWNIRRKKAVFICQNPSFDRLFFSQIIDPETQEMEQFPYHWLDLASMYWSAQMNRSKKEEVPYPWEGGFTKDLIASQYSILPEKSPHRAMNGAKHLIACYQAIIGFPHSAKPAEKSFGLLTRKAK